MEQITGNDINGMAQHWLNTPMLGYLGSDYGNDIKSWLQEPQSSITADRLVAKIEDDIPILKMVDDAVRVFSEHSGVDAEVISISIAGRNYDLQDVAD